MGEYDFGELLGLADEGGFAVFPRGDYDCELDKAVAKKTGTSKDKISITFKIISGPHAGKGQIYNDFIISPDNTNALGFFFRHMAAMGLDRNYFASNPKLEKVAEDLTKMKPKVRVTLSTRTWQGQERNNVDALSPIGPVGVVPQAGVPKVTKAAAAAPRPTMPSPPVEAATAPPGPALPF
jgi:uncharacterized protein DUF669